MILILKLSILKIQRESLWKEREGKEDGMRESGREGETERERPGDPDKRDNGKLFTNSLITQISNLVITKKHKKSNI